MDHRLLAVDILAGVHGVDGRLLVPVVGRGNEHGIHVLAGENLTIVARGEQGRAPALAAVLQAAGVAVGNGDQLHTRNLQRDAGVILPLAAGTDQRQADAIVGGDSGRHFCCRFRSQGVQAWSGNRGCGKQSGCAEKAAAIEGCRLGRGWVGGRMRGGWGGRGLVGHGQSPGATGKRTIKAIPIARQARCRQRAG